MNIKKIAEGLVEELNVEFNKKNEEVKMLKGAIQGVEFFYSRLMEEIGKPSEQDSSTADSSKKAKAKK
jgi:hypothetical protein